jgi:hypothetical protein
VNAVGVADFARVSPPTGVVTGVVVLDVDVTEAPPGGAPEAVAVLLTEPFVWSAVVMVYGPETVHVVVAFGASVVPWQVMVSPASSGSATDTLVRVTFPVLVTANEYVIRSPASTNPSELLSAMPATVFTSRIDGVRVTATMASEAGDVIAGPVGGLPVAVAVLRMEPASISAWVAAYTAVHVIDDAGARAVAGHDTVGAGAAGGVRASASEMPVSVTFPVLRTTKEYVTLWPTVVTDVGVAVLTTVRAGAALMLTVAEFEFAVTVPPAGSRPVTRAVSTMLPLSASACDAT